MRGLRSLPQVLILIITLTLVISPSLGVQNSVGISSSGIINYLGETNQLPRLHVEGTYIRDEFGTTVYLKGVNFYTSQWWFERRGTEEQIIYMKNWGSNVVALSIDGWALKDDGSPKDPAMYDILDRLVSWAEKHGMYVVLRFMSGGWGRGSPDKWTSSADWQAWIDFWKIIATRYRGRTHVLYDLINEPVGVTPYDGTPLNEFYSARIRGCIDAIRTIDPEVICIVQEIGSDWWRMGFGFEQTNPINRPNVVFSGHQYQSKEWDPEYAKESIRADMTRKKWDWITANNRSFWVGEFNTENALVGDPTYHGELWLRNFIELCEEYGFAGWAAWWWNAEGGRHALITDWNGTPSATGSIIKEYLPPP